MKLVQSYVHLKIAKNDQKWPNMMKLLGFGKNRSFFGHFSRFSNEATFFQCNIPNASRWYARFILRSCIYQNSRCSLRLYRPRRYSICHAGARCASMLRKSWHHCHLKLSKSRAHIIIIMPDRGAYQRETTIPSNPTVAVLALTLQ